MFTNIKNSLFQKGKFETMKNNYLTIYAKKKVINNNNLRYLLTSPPMIKQIDNLQYNTF